jgi:hypothetical protein
MFGSGSDDARLTSALTYVQAQTNIPGIQLPNRSLHFSLQRTLFSGCKIIGANPGGPMNLELSSGKFVANEILYDGPGFWWSGPGSGNTYDVYFANMAIQYGAGSGFLANPTGNLYACQWHNMNHYQAAGVFGNSTTKVLMTQNVLSGHWTVLGFTDQAFHVGGSDNSFWENGYLNIDNSQNAPVAGTYMMSFDAIGKTHVGKVYMTCRAGTGWRGIDADPTLNNPHLTFDSVWFEGTPTLTADGILFRQTDGTCHIHNLFFGRAMGSPLGDGSEHGCIQIQGVNSQCTIDQATYDRQLTGLTVPAIAVTGGSLRVRNVLNVNHETTIVANLGTTGSPVTIVADSSVSVQPDLSTVPAKPPIQTAMLDLPGTTTDYLTSGVLAGYTGSDFDIRMYVAPDNWASGATQVIFSHSDAGSSSGSSGQRSLLAYLAPNTHLGVIVVPTGAGPSQQNIEDPAGGPPGHGNGVWSYLRVTWKQNNGTNGLVTFYTSTDGVTWTSYATATVTGILANHVSTHRMSIGVRDNKDQAYAGGIGWVQVRNGIGGAVVAEVDFRDSNWVGTDGAGNVWSLVGKNSGWRLT